MESVHAWDDTRWNIGDKVAYRDIGLFLDPRYRGIITGFASANIALVKWRHRLDSVTEFIPNLQKHDW